LQTLKDISRILKVIIISPFTYGHNVASFSLPTSWNIYVNSPEKLVNTEEKALLQKYKFQKGDIKMRSDEKS
jgi:hypothetical protein